MVTETKPVESPAKKESSKGIPVGEFKAFKEAALNRERKLKEQLEEKDTQISNLQSELRIVKMDADDPEDIKAVKAELLRRDSELTDRETKQQKGLTSLSEREKKVRAKELIADYKEKGLTIEVDTLLSADDMDKLVLDKYNEFLAEENTKLKETKSPESAEKPVYETGAVSVNKKQPKDMTDEEFEAHKIELKNTYLNKQ